MRITRRFLLSGGTLGAAVAAVGGWRLLAQPAQAGTAAPQSFEVTMSDAEWRKKLTAAQCA